MSHKACPHGAVLPRGLRCDRGYLIIRIATEQGPYNQGCGPHTPAMEKVAKLAIEDIRVRQKLGTFGLPSKARRIMFKDAFEIFFQKHYVSWRDPSTNEPRGEQAQVICRSMSKHLLEYFGDFFLDAITVKSINNYKSYRIETEDAANATFNKEKGILSVLLNLFKVWVKGEEIDPVKLPEENPCEFVMDLREIPRNRIASSTELTRLRKACEASGDLELWTVTLFALDTGLRFGDLRRAAGKVGTIHMKQGKTGGDVILPESPFAKSLTSESFRNFEYRWNKVCNLSGLEDLQFRDLRRTSATIAKQQNATTALIKDALGHKDSKTTEGYLNVKDPEAIRPLVLARRKILESL